MTHTPDQVQRKSPVSALHCIGLMDGFKSIFQVYWQAVPLSAQENAKALI